MERLTLLNVTLSDAGWYTCVVNNIYGQKQQSSWIEVLRERSVDGIAADNSILFVAIIIAFCAFAAAVIVIAICWQRHRPPKSRPLVLKENSVYFQPLNLPVDPDWEISRFRYVVELLLNM